MASTSSSSDFIRINLGSFEVTLAAVAAPLSATPLLVSAFRVKAVKAAGGGANTGVSYMGDSVNQKFQLAAAEPAFDIMPMEIGLIDLSKVYVKGTAGDGLTIQYQVPARASF